MRRRSSQRGTTILIIVVLLAASAMVLAGVVQSGAREQFIAAQRLSTLRSFYAAEAGMNMGLREVALTSDEDGDGSIGGISDDDSDENDQSIGVALVAVSAVEDGDETLLTSIGRAGESTRRIVARMATEGGGTAPGLDVRYFALERAPNRISDIDWDATPTATDVVAQLNWSRTSDSIPFWEGGPNYVYAADFTGYVTVDASGVWTFTTESDDGSMMYIDGALVVTNDGYHSMRKRSGTIALTEGTHEIRVQYFEGWGRHGLIAYWQGPDVPVQTVIPASAFSH
jgi:hypothetical protein